MGVPKRGAANIFIGVFYQQFLSDHMTNVSYTLSLFNPILLTIRQITISGL